MPDRVKLCEYCGRIWYEEDHDPQQYFCPDDGTELIDTKIVYTEEEIKKWRNRNDKQEAKIIDQDAEISELKIACNNYKDMYVEKMSENKKLKNYLEEIGYELADECPSSKNTIFKMIKEALEETDG